MINVAPQDFEDFEDIDFSVGIPVADAHPAAGSALGMAASLTVAPLPNLFELLPIPDIDLTPSEKQTVERYQLGRILLGPVSAAPLTCPAVYTAPPDAIGGMTMLALVAKNKACPYMRSCPLLKQGKAPHGEPCPLETTYVLERFVRWSNELGSTAYTLSETDRVATSQLTSIDLHEHRCLSILGEAESARLTDISVSETATNGDPLSYEKVIHINQQALAVMREQRRKILHDFELTPEMKTKKAKYATGEAGADLATLQSARADKFKEYKAKRPQVPTAG